MRNPCQVSHVDSSLVFASPDEGASTPMATVARTMRARTTAEMERQANAQSAQMALPTMLFGLGYLIFLLYAAMGAVSAGLNH